MAEDACADNAAILVAKDVSRQFFRKGRDAARHFDAVAGISLELARGELVEVVGRSGSGKSTLLNMLAGLLAPTGGQVLLDGRDIYALDDKALSSLRNRRMGVIPQGQTALFNLTVGQNVSLPALLRADSSNMDATAAERRAQELLDGLGIGELIDSYPEELSGGEMRRMAIARALSCSPDVIFADEPTSDLDDENTRLVLETLRHAADAGAAVLLVTHEQEAAAYADRMFKMDAGKLLAL